MKNLRGFRTSVHSEPQPGSATDEMKKAAGKYAGMNETELEAELNRAVKETKANGTYDGAKMRAYASLIAPRLTAEQSARLFKMLDEIDGD